MSDLAKKFDELLAGELKDLKEKKAVLEAEIVSLTAQCDKVKSDTDKEVAQKKAQCDIECNDNLNVANTLLKEAKESNALADKRKEESVIIEKQMADLEEKSKKFKDTEKEIESVRISLLEKEKKAELLIEQYNKKLEDLVSKK
jgi:chromosome segregation ATPase